MFANYLMRVRTVIAANLAGILAAMVFIWVLMLFFNAGFIWTVKVWAMYFIALLVAIAYGWTGNSDFRTSGYQRRGAGVPRGPSLSSSHDYNPVSGLPMVSDGFDSSGNSYGTDSGSLFHH